MLVLRQEAGGGSPRLGPIRRLHLPPLRRALQRDPGAGGDRGPAAGPARRAPGKGSADPDRGHLLLNCLKRSPGTKAPLAWPAGPAGASSVGLKAVLNRGASPGATRRYRGVPDSPDLSSVLGEAV